MIREEFVKMSRIKSKQQELFKSVFYLTREIAWKYSLKI